MHEHISNELIYMEIGGKEEMQAKQRVEVNNSCLPQGEHGHETQEIYDNEVAGYRGYSKHNLLYNSIFKPPRIADKATSLQNYEKKPLKVHSASLLPLFLGFYVIFLFFLFVE